MGSLRDTTVWTRPEAGARLDHWEVGDLLRSDPMAHRICWREGQDATREGFEVRGEVRGMPLENDPEAKKAWSAYWKRLEVTRLITQARGQARAYAGSSWVLWVDDGRRSDEPIDWLNIRDISWIRVVRGGRHGLIQPLDVVRDPSSPRYQQPRLYNVSFPEGGSGVFHWHRIIVWQGEIFDDEAVVANNGWGESVLDRVWTALMRFGASHQYALGALVQLSKGVFQSEFLGHALMAGNSAEVARRLEDVSIGSGLYGDIALGQNESYTIAGRPIAGIEGVLKALTSALTMATDMPQMVLEGRRPGGLSTAADGEFRGWYDYVASLQEPIYSPPVLRLVEIASRAARGPTLGVPVLDPDIYWPPLWQLTEGEKLDNRVKAAQARATDISSDVVSVEEARSDADLDTWYRLGEIAPPPEDEALAEGQAAAKSEVPEDEELITPREAATILGYRTTTAARNLASQLGALYELRPGLYRIGRQTLMAALRAAKVEEPAAPAPAE
jgi:phage-related protein (TIGR01555 family)